MIELVVEDALRKHDRVSRAVWTTFLNSIKLIHVYPQVGTGCWTLYLIFGVVKAFESFSEILSFYLRSSKNLWFLDRFSILC